MLIFAANLKCMLMKKREEYVEICGGDKFVSLDNVSEQNNSAEDKEDG